MTGIRGNAIQLYAFDYPITVNNNTINSWGRNSETANGTKQDAAIRGEIRTTNGVAGTLTLENNYFGMDESTSIFHVYVANYDHNTNIDHNRAAGTY